MLAMGRLFGALGGEDGLFLGVEQGDEDTALKAETAGQVRVNKEQGGLFQLFADLADTPGYLGQGELVGGCKRMALGAVQRIVGSPAMGVGQRRYILPIAGLLNGGAVQLIEGVFEVEDATFANEDGGLCASRHDETPLC